MARHHTIVTLARRALIGLAVLLLVFFIGRIYQSEQGAALHSWHRWVADELSADETDRASFADYKQREARIFQQMKAELNDTLSDKDKNALNRFNPGSAVYPARFHTDWNRSFILMPKWEIRGAVVLLHGLTDSPYSMRYLAEDYQQRGFVAVVPRLPGHGTAPGSLTAVNWQSWMAVTRLAVREATRLAGVQRPLHLVGYSNGGALAMKYALESLSDSHLRAPQQIVLLSPMIGVTGYARFAGVAGWPALFPAFARTAWLNVLPEYNPFKYNSFPVNAARQSWLLTQALQAQIVQAARSGQISALAPVLTFQSVMDATVSTRAVVDALYHYLPRNGSSLVIFDINQAANMSALFRAPLPSAVSRLLPAAPRAYAATVITNRSPVTYQTEARTIKAGEVEERVEPLDLAWPRDMFSLSHIAVPFPLSDDLYGEQPGEKNRYGISLGTLSLRGETSSLTVGPETFMRATSSPFFSDMMARVNARIACSGEADYLACIGR